MYLEIVVAMGHTVMGQVICMEYYVEPDLQFDDETEVDTRVWDVPLLLEPEPPPAPPPRSDELQTVLLQAVEPDPAWTVIQHWRSVGPASTWAPLPQQLGHLSRHTLAGGVRRRVEPLPPPPPLPRAWGEPPPPPPPPPAVQPLPPVLLLGELEEF